MGEKVNGFAFQQILQLLNTTLVPKTNKDQQSISIWKQLHQTVATVLKTLLLANHYGHAARLQFLWMMLWPLSCMPWIPQFQLHCKPHLEDTFSQGRFLNILLLADWYAILVCREQSVNGVLLCPHEQLINLTLWLVKKSSNMTKLLKVNLNQKLLEPLRFFGSTQCHCDDKLAVLPMVLMFDVPCHIRSPHLCNLTWNSCFFLINYVEALLHLSPDSQETPLVDFHMSFLWFFVISWAWAMHAHSCHSLVLSLCVLNALSSLYPPYHNFWKYHYSKLGILGICE